MSTAIKRAEIQSQVTNSIVAALEEGVRPWLKPWAVTNDERVNRPMRHDGEKYSGINIVTLWTHALSRGYTSPYWLTYAQTEKLGGYVMKGEQAITAVYAGRLYKTETDEDGEETEVEIPFMRGYKVFNAEQAKGLPLRYYIQPRSTTRRPLRRIEQAERFFAHTKAEIRTGGGSAYYCPASDYIQMPPFETFRDAESHAATLAHELTHWTAHQSRVNRDFGGKRWGDPAYAFEELVAELASAFLCADLAITPEIRGDHASYIANWLEVLKNDKRAIFSAAAHASKAVDFLHGLQPPTEGNGAKG